MKILIGSLAIALWATKYATQYGSDFNDLLLLILWIVLVVGSFGFAFSRKKPQAKALRVLAWTPVGIALLLFLFLVPVARGGLLIAVPFLVVVPWLLLRFEKTVLPIGNGWAIGYWFAGAFLVAGMPVGLWILYVGILWGFVWGFAACKDRTISYLWIPTIFMPHAASWIHFLLHEHSLQWLWSQQCAHYALGSLAHPSGRLLVVLLLAGLLGKWCATRVNSKIRTYVFPSLIVLAMVLGGVSIAGKIYRVPFFLGYVTEQQRTALSLRQQALAKSQWRMEQELRRPMEKEYVPPRFPVPRDTAMVLQQGNATWFIGKFNSAKGMDTLVFEWRGHPFEKDQEEDSLYAFLKGKNPEKDFAHNPGMDEYPHTFCHTEAGDAAFIVKYFDGSNVPGGEYLYTIKRHTGILTRQLLSRAMGESESDFEKLVTRDTSSIDIFPEWEDSVDALHAKPMIACLCRIDYWNSLRSILELGEKLGDSQGPTFDAFAENVLAEKADTQYVPKVPKQQAVLNLIHAIVTFYAQRKNEFKGIDSSEYPILFHTYTTANFKVVTIILQLDVYGAMNYLLVQDMQTKQWSLQYSAGVSSKGFNAATFAVLDSAKDELSASMCVSNCGWNGRYGSAVWNLKEQKIHISTVEE